MFTPEPPSTGTRDRPRAVGEVSWLRYCTHETLTVKAIWLVVRLNCPHGIRRGKTTVGETRM